MNKLYKFWMNLRYKLGFINKQGDSIGRLKQLHKTCIKLRCGNRGDVYNQCHQPEQCFVCKYYRKATKTKDSDYSWKWVRQPFPNSLLMVGKNKKKIVRKNE